MQENLGLRLSICGVWIVYSYYSKIIQSQCFIYILDVLLWLAGVLFASIWEKEKEKIFLFITVRKEHTNPCKSSLYYTSNDICLVANTKTIIIAHVCPFFYDVVY